MGLGLLQLPLSRQRIVTGNGAKDLLGFAFDGIDQTFACLAGFVAFAHRTSPS
jgi:hypothetical protein